MSWTTATAAFAEALPGYEERAEQTRLAQSIEGALAQGQHLCAQAGCGTGKSFAYLVTGIDHALATRRPVVVSTETKALMDQLANKDLPFLQQVRGDFTFAVLKGRGNYVCLAKASSPEAQQVGNLGAIMTELDEVEGHTGDLDTFVTEIDPRDRQHLSVSQDECVGRKSCPFGDVCLAERAKQKAAEAAIVITNHAMLMRDLAVKELTGGKGGMLPHYGRLILDEAHSLEDVATGALGQEFTRRQLERFADDVATFLKDKDANTELRDASRILFTKLDVLLGKSNDPLRIDDEKLVTIFDELADVLNAVKALRVKINDLRPTDDTEKLSKQRIYNRTSGVLGRVSAIMMAEDGDLVRWVEREERVIRGRKESTLKLAYAPLHVGPYLQRTLWSHVPAVLVSATLKTGDKGFEYITGRLGMEDYEGFDAGTPFDFAKQSALYIPAPTPTGTFPENPNHATWAARMAAEAGELIRAAGGRTLFLFTSRRSMEATYTVLAPSLRKRGITVFKQGDMPNGKIAQVFAADETGVLFALKSFMTGADFQGDTVRLVIIDKLPFAPPTDVIFQARAEAIDAVATSWNTKSFMGLSVPMMTLTLLQAFGRGVRTKQDHAMIAIFDSRLVSKGYGRVITRALPPAKRVNTLDAAMDYLDGLMARTA